MAYQPYLESASVAGSAGSAVARSGCSMASCSWLCRISRAVAWVWVLAVSRSVLALQANAAVATTAATTVATLAQRFHHCSGVVSLTAPPFELTMDNAGNVRRLGTIGKAGGLRWISQLVKPAAALR